MRRISAAQVAASTAFASSRDGSPSTIEGGTIRLRLHPGALAFVVGFPGAGGALALVAAFSRTGTSDGAFVLAVALIGVALALLVLGLRSFVQVDPEGVTVRFLGLRSTTVRFSQLVSATFGMIFPSVSYVITLANRDGRKARIHANWWQGESAVIRPVCKALLDRGVPMDRSTARLVSQVLRVKRPRAQIVHHGLIRKDRTW